MNPQSAIETIDKMIAQVLTDKANAEQKAIELSSTQGKTKADEYLKKAYKRLEIQYNELEKVKTELSKLIRYVDVIEWDNSELTTEALFKKHLLDNLLELEELEREQGMTLEQFRWQETGHSRFSIWNPAQLSSDELQRKAKKLDEFLAAQLPHRFSLEDQTNLLNRKIVEVGHFDKHNEFWAQLDEQKSPLIYNFKTRNYERIS